MSAEGTPNRTALRLQVISPEDLERAVHDRCLHLGVGPKFRPLPGLTYEPLFRERYLLYCGRDHSLFSQRLERVSQLKLHPLCRPSHAGAEGTGAQDVFPEDVGRGHGKRRNADLLRKVPRLSARSLCGQLG